MKVLHVSINAEEPEVVAHFLAQVTGGTALPFPPIPGAWITFSPDDTGHAVEVYPLETRLVAGPNQVAFIDAEPRKTPEFCHIALTSDMDRDKVIAAAEALHWKARWSNRGPFDCTEIWLENRVMIEILDPEAQENYAKGMTVAHWKSMFGMD